MQAKPAWPLKPLPQPPPDPPEAAPITKAASSSQLHKPGTSSILSNSISGAFGMFSLDSMYGSRQNSLKHIWHTTSSLRTNCSSTEALARLGLTPANVQIRDSGKTEEPAYVPVVPQSQASTEHGESGSCMLPLPPWPQQQLTPRNLTRAPWEGISHAALSNKTGENPISQENGL
jgi:hypothetical protein